MLEWVAFHDQEIEDALTLENKYLHFLVQERNRN